MAIRVKSIPLQYITISSRIKTEHILYFTIDVTHFRVFHNVFLRSVTEVLKRPVRDVRKMCAKQFFNNLSILLRSINGKHNQTTVRHILFQINMLLLLDRRDTLRYINPILMVFWRYAHEWYVKTKHLKTLQRLIGVSTFLAVRPPKTGKCIVFGKKLRS